jgi:hypothetical protein
MAVTEVGTPGAVQIASGTNSLSQAGAFSGTQPRTAGDFLVAEVTAAGTTTSGTISTPSGWTQAAVVTSGTGRQQVAIYTRVATGADAAPTFTATATGTAAQARMSVFLREFTGQDATTPIPAGGTGTGDATSGAVSVVSSGNVPAAGCVAVACVNTGLNAAATDTYTAGTGFTNDYNTGSTSARFHSASDSQAGPTSGSAVTDAAASTGTVLEMSGVIIVIQPTVSGVTGSGSLALAPLAFTGAGLAGLTGSGSLALAPLAFTGAGSPTGPVAPLGIFIYTGTPALGNLAISVTPVSGTDAFGNAYGSGLNVGNQAAAHFGADKTGDIFIANALGQNVIEIRPELGAMLLYGGAPALGNLLVSLASASGSDPQGNAFLAGLQTALITSFTGSGGLPLLVNLVTVPTGAAFMQIGTSGGGPAFILPTQPGSASAAESWHTFTPGNSWAASVSGPGTLYRLTVQDEVQISAGLNCTGATVADGTVVATLPTGYRPATVHTFPVACDQLRIASGSNNEGARFALNTSGQLLCFGIAAAATAVGIEVKVPLDV